MNRIRTGRALALAALALAAQAGTASAQQLPPAQQIVDKYVQAIGGRAMLGRFNTRHTVAEMSMPAMGMTMTMNVYQARPNKVVTRMDMGAMGTATGGYDGTVAWSNNSMQGPRILTGSELNETLSRASFDASLDMAASFPTMETVGSRTVAGQECWDVRMVSRTGVTVRNCFDKTTGLVVASVAKQQSQMGEMEVEMVYSDYKEFDGIKMPTKTTMNMMGQQMVTTVKSVSHAPIPDTTFALPAEIRALTP
ncbi:MAG TPA: DUF4412 domain-containing protein [Longimicrobium sp.]|nr:DUF4412 domain-containing protein [Longimicrobium sp.]